MRAALLASLLLACGSEATPAPAPAPPDPVDVALEHGASFLAMQQGPDGGFHSHVYSAFRDGRATTPLALMALWIAPQQEGAYQRGLRFVAEGDPASSEYPIYTASLSMLVLGMPRNGRYLERIAAFQRVLRERQQDDGGWGYLDEPSNLSSTLFAIGALRLNGAAATDPTLVRARAFVESCQNFSATPDARFDDGGFFHSPGYGDSNKAGEAGSDASGHTRYRSYGSMTADGYRALTRLGSAPTDPRMQAAAAWLHAHFTAQRNPGEYGPVNEVRRESGYYYWVWTIAHAMREMGETAWARPMIDELVHRQGSDGSWRNRYTEMREDDPLVATSFAMASLAIARTVVRGETRSHATERAPR